MKLANKTITLGAVTLFALTGCSSISYKGVTVYIKQEAGGSAYADSASVPDHQQGSDVAVPLLKEVGDIYSAQLDAALKALKECRKLISDGHEVNCNEITIPERPQLPVEPTDPTIPPVVNPDPGEPVDPGNPDVPVPNASWAGGNLWKPVSDSRGGVPVVLTKPSAPHCNDVNLYDGTDQIPTTVEYRGLTNGARETYFLLDKKASTLPRDLIVEVCSQVFLVPDPNQRYD